MALTNFGTLSGDQLQAWSRDFWKVARNQSFINQFAGSGSNAMVQRITELTKNNKGMTSASSWISCVSQTVLLAV